MSNYLPCNSRMTGVNSVSWTANLLGSFLFSVSFVLLDL